MDAHDKKRLSEIAYVCFGVETPKQRNSDRLDFYSVAVWNIRAGLKSAYELGMNAKQEILKDAVRLALRNAESALYMLPASDDYKVSAQKDILSAQIGRYRSALGLNQPEIVS